MNYLVISDIVSPESNSILIRTGAVVNTELLALLETHYGLDELAKLVMPIYLNR